MGWLRRAKEEKKEAPSQAPEPAAPEPVPEIGQKRAELEEIQSEVAAASGSLKSVRERLAEVRLEYDAAVGQLMATKKELHEAKKEIEAAALLQKNAQAKLASALSNAEEESRKQRQREGKIRELDSEISKKRQSIGELDSAKALLAEVKDEITRDQTREADLRARIAKSEIDMGKALAKQKAASKRLAEIEQGPDRPKKEAPAAGAAPDSRGVVEAASAVVSSMGKKLKMAQKELEVVNGLLQKERLAHAATRDKLAKLQGH